MSSIEERLQRDIAAVTQGVVVTESNLRDARNAIDDRVEIKTRKDRRRSVMVAAAAAVVIPIVGIVAVQAMNDGDTSTAPPSDTLPDDPYETFIVGREPTTQLVNGVWRLDNGYMLVWFKADGTVQLNDSGGLFGKPSTTGTYAIQGENVTITTTPGGADGAACAGTELALRARLPLTGTMHVVNPGSSGPCSVVGVGDQWVLQQSLPTLDEEMATFAPAGEPFEPVTKPGVLYGDWLAVGGGHMLELSRDGSYQVAGESSDIVDRGQWSLAGQELELVSGSDSPTCNNGDRLVLSQSKHADPGDSEFLRGTVATNACGGAWAQVGTWYLLPHAGN